MQNRGYRSGFTGLVLGMMCVAALAAVAAAQPVPAIRNKLSAGDFFSAESILEVHRRDKGEDSQYLQGLGWLARGAAMLGEWPAAEQYASKAQLLSETKLRAEGEEKAKDAVAALGAALETKAMVLELAERITAGRAIDCGPLGSARALEGLTAVIVNVNKRYKAHAGVRISGIP